MASPLNLLNTVDAITTINQSIVANQNIEISDVQNLQATLTNLQNTKEDVFTVAYPIFCR